MKPWPFQDAAIRQIAEGYRGGVRRQLLVMATGLGKTVVSACLGDYLPDLVAGGLLFIVHREELALQAASTFRNKYPHLSIGIEMGARKIKGHERIVVSSVQTLGRRGSSRINKFDDFRVIVIDEAHHCTEGGLYARVLDHFGLGPGTYTNSSDLPSYRRDLRLLVGVTATPNRGDGRGLQGFFDDMVQNETSDRGWDLLWGIEQGYLVPIRARAISTGIDASGVRIQRGDFREDDLSHALDTDERNEMVARALHNRMEERPDMHALLFCVNVAHAIHLSAVLRSHGMGSFAVFADRQQAPVSTEAVYGVTRQDIIRSFRDREFPALCNVGIASEGFNVREIDTIGMTRLTTSALLYEQQVGRATRIVHEPNVEADAEARRADVASSAKDHMMILDFVDNVGRHAQSIMTAPQLFGLPADFRDESVTLNEAERIIRERELADPLRNYRRARSLDEIQIIEQEVSVFDIARPPRQLTSASRLSWMEVRDGLVQILLPTRMAGQHQDTAITLTRDRLGQWTAEMTRLQRWADGRFYRQTSQQSDVHYGTLEQALSATDRWVRLRYPSLMNLVETDQPWRENAVTDGQKKELRRRGIETPAGWTLTSGLASSLINAHRALTGR
jgi:superfamily II DNA or RNA helicase